MKKLRTSELTLKDPKSKHMAHKGELHSHMDAIFPHHTNVIKRAAQDRRDPSVYMSHLTNHTFLQSFSKASQSDLSFFIDLARSPISFMSKPSVGSLVWSFEHFLRFFKTSSASFK